MTKVDGASLRVRVRLERPLAPSDELGGGALAFEDVGGAFIELSPGVDGERTQFDGVVPFAAYSARVRSPSAIASGWRLKWGARSFRVLSLRDGEPLRHFIELALEEEFR